MNEGKRTTVRAIVTGSRGWKDQDRVHEVLDALHAVTVEMRRILVLREGECPEGVDHMAKEWVEVQSVRMPGTTRLDGWAANWRSCAPDCPPGHFRRGRCPTAGFRRNEEMVDAGAEVCLAFWKDSSNGTKHCSEYARKSGIPTVMWRMDRGVASFPDPDWLHRLALVL